MNTKTTLENNSWKPFGYGEYLKEGSNDFSTKIQFYITKVTTNNIEFYNSCNTSSKIARGSAYHNLFKNGIDNKIKALFCLIYLPLKITLTNQLIKTNKIIDFIFRYTFNKKSFYDTCALDTEIKKDQDSKYTVGEYTDDNGVIVTENPKETTEWKLALIKNANSSIEISGSYCGGEIFREALHAIDKRMEERPKLKVSLLSVTDLLEKEDIARGINQRENNNI
jgi:hypothetical protein